jgi:uncharacterized protein YdhG (YjbR/CyaY superfamily)
MAYASVDDYLASLPEPRAAALRHLRALILETVPGVEESIQYNMPAYTYHGMLCAFAAQKHYMSFYVLDGAIVNQNRHLLAGLSVGKGCIRFKDGAALADETVRTLLRQVVAANAIKENNHC